MNNLKLISAITDGQKILATENFCSSTYNIIVLDPERPSVLRVVSIGDDTLQLLTNLLQELASYCVSPAEQSPLTETLNDVHEAIQHVLRHLGLNVSPSSLQRLTFSQISKLVFSTLSVLFLGLVSFINSHLCLEKISGNLFGTQLEIKISDGHEGSIFMAPPTPALPRWFHQTPGSGL
jgi:hypothetical protein